MSGIAISVSNVSKCYRAFESQRSRLIHSVWPKYTKGIQEVWALKDINFEIKRGESVAIIGRNGSGKSTLLEILTGTLTPTTGSVKVNGRVSALLELGSGFNPEYSGRDNVVLNGLLLGLSKDEILSRFREIEAFAEIGTAVDRPVKTYSSGMMMRLAFAVQVLCDPDILIIDEALTVGDFFFQQKCFKHLQKMRDRDLTLLLVSHDMSAVRDLCADVLFLHDGHTMFHGESSAGIQRYLLAGSAIDNHLDKFNSPAVSVSETLIKNDSTLNDSSTIWKSIRPVQELTALLSISLLNQAGQQVKSLRIGDTLKIRVYYQVYDPRPVHVSIVLKNRMGQVVNCTSTHTLGRGRVLSRGTLASIDITLAMVLEAGQYALMVSLGCVEGGPNQGVALSETPWLGPLTVYWDYGADPPPFMGMFGLPAGIDDWRDCSSGEQIMIETV